MKAAVLDRPFHIRFGGATDFQYVADTAAAFLACADGAPEGAHVFNLHGETVTVDPIAPAMDDTAIRNKISSLPSTPLEIGIRETMDRFALLRDAGRLDTSDLI